MTKNIFQLGWEWAALDNPNLRWVVIGMLLLGAVAGAVGCFALLRKRSLLGDAAAHAALPGICIVFMLLGTKNPAFMLLGAVIAGGIALKSIDVLTSQTRIKADTAITLVLSVFFAVGILLLTHIQHTGNAAQAGLERFLFGKAAAMLQGDINMLLGVALLTSAALFLFFRPLQLVAFDRNYAQSIGLPLRRLETLLALLTILVVGIGMQAVGVVLISSLLIAPAAAARYWTDDLRKMIVIAATFGAISGVVGAYISYIAPAMPTGPWVVVVVSALVGFSLMLAPQKGWWALQRRQNKNRRKIVRENILKSFYHLAEKDGNPFAARTTNDLNNQRKDGLADLRSNLGELTREGLLHEQQQQWTLTESGRIAAQRVVRLHRLWELYLNRYVRIASDHVHDDAEAIEHVLTPELEAQLLKKLNYPTHDPHEELIP